MIAAGGYWVSRSDGAPGPAPRASVGSDEPAEEPREPSVPSELHDAPIETLRTELGATAAFDVSRDGTRIYAFFFEVVPHAYDVDFFRWSVERARFERFGPMIGPSITPMPQMAMAWPRFSGG